MWSFVWRKFSSVGREEWCDKMKYGKKLKLGDALRPKKYRRGTSVKAWGCLGIPSSSTKHQVIFLDAIFLLLHMLCVVLGASFFVFLVFFCFVCCIIWLDPNIFVLERDTLHFHCIERSSFHSYCSASVLVF